MAATAEWITVEEYAAHYSVAPRTVRRWIEAGYLRVLRPGPAGRLVRIHRSELHKEASLPDAA